MVGWLVSQARDCEADSSMLDQGKVYLDISNRLQACSRLARVDLDGRVYVHGSDRCDMYRLCPICARSRAMRFVRLYADRLRDRLPGCQVYACNLTIPNGPDLAERFEYLSDSLRRLKKAWHNSRNQGRGGPLEHVAAAVWSVEIKRGEGSGEWHPHLHGLLACSGRLDFGEVLPVWRRCASATNGWLKLLGTGADCRVGKDFAEVFKYALKFSDLDFCDQLAANATMRGRRLLRVWGEFVGMDSDEDEPDTESTSWVLGVRYDYQAGEYLFGSDPVGVGREIARRLDKWRESRLRRRGVTNAQSKMETFE